MHRVFGMTLGTFAVLLVAGCVPYDAVAQRYGGSGQQQVYCASNDNRGTRCRMPWRDSVLAQQMSDSACIEGRTWGSDPYSVWIKGGCRGNFVDARGWGRRGYGYGYDRGYGRGDYDGDDGYGRGGYDSGNRGRAEVYCASNDNRGARCQVPWSRAVLSRQMSQSACIEGETWGSDPYSVWVRGGCRGQFRAAWGGRGGW